MTAFRVQARIAAATLLIAALAAPLFAYAADPAPAATPERAAQLQALTDCRKITDPNERVACYDKATKALDQAEEKGDVVVVDRDQARKVRRQAFGFVLPSMSLFTRGEKPEDVTSTEGTIASARKLLTGKWEVKLQDGATWVQVDLTEIPIDPKPGQPVKIKTGMVGSYLMTINNQREVKVHREQ